MKKNLLTKMVALTLAVVTALTPVTADASTKKVVTREDYDAHCAQVGAEYEAAIEADWNADEEALGMEANQKDYAFVKSLNGCFQKDGRKIYCLLNDAKKTFTKTGKYSIVAGGTSAEKDQGRVVFKAPKSGTYRFTMTTKNNVVGGDIAASCLSDESYKWCKRTYKHKGKTTTNPKCGFALVNDPADDAPAGTNNTGTIFDGNGGYTSTMTKIYFTTTLKKGQCAYIDVRASGASYNEPDECAYNFCGMDLDITKIK